MARAHRAVTVILELLEYGFMQRALVAALLVGLAAPSVGVYIVQRRLALIGDGIGHVALAGVAIGVLTTGQPVLTALAAAAVLVAGMVLAATVGALVLTTAAGDVGRAIGEGLASPVTEDLGYHADPYATGGIPGSVEQSDPVPPGELGSDTELDGYAQSCFTGDLQACDDLYMESPPLSAYEEYATTCGGRVKAFEVPFCADLD